MKRWPSYSDEEIDLVCSILKSGKVNYWSGDVGRKFEEEFAVYTGNDHAIACANGTVALIMAYKAVGVDEESEVITTPRTFVATSSAAAMCGASLRYADVDYWSGCITAKSIEPLVTDRTKCVSVVHLGGHPGDIESIARLCKEKGISLIEDCSQAHGASVNGKIVGSFGDIGVWSFCQDKIISTGGEGGMVATSNELYAERMFQMKDHGRNRRQVGASSKTSASFKWTVESIGMNYRLTEMQSALGRYQLKRLEHNLRRRQDIADVYEEILGSCSEFRFPSLKENERCAYYRFYVYCQGANSGERRNWLIEEMQKHGYSVNVGSCPEVWREKGLKQYTQQVSSLRYAQMLGETSIALPISHLMSNEDAASIAEALVETSKQFSVYESLRD